MRPVGGRSQGLVQLAHRRVIATTGSTQEALKPVLELVLRRCVENAAKLSDELVGASELCFEAEESAQLAALLVALPLPGSQHQPARAFASGSQLRCSPEEHRPPQFRDGLASALGR